MHGTADADDQNAPERFLSHIRGDSKEVWREKGGSEAESNHQRPQQGKRGHCGAESFACFPVIPQSKIACQVLGDSGAKAQVQKSVVADEA